MAFYIATRPKLKRSILIFIILVPFFTSFLLRIYAWMILLKKSGILNNSLKFIGIIDEPISFLSGICI
jgi:ABC-type spermidine/putrescine transport system permease subunit I